MALSYFLLSALLWVEAHGMVLLVLAAGKQVPGSCRDTEWSGWTCLYGFPVMGIWPDTADGSDINACDRWVQQHTIARHAAAAASAVHAAYVCSLPVC